MKKKVKFSRIAENRYVTRGPAPNVHQEVVPVRILTRCKGGGTCYRTFYVTPEKAAQYGQGALLEGTIFAAQAMTGLRVPEQYQKFLGLSWGAKHCRVSGILYSYENLFQYGSSVHVTEQERKNDGWTETVQLSGERQITTTFVLKKYAGNPRLTYISTVDDVNLVTKKIQSFCPREGELTIKSVTNYSFVEFMWFVVNMRQKFKYIHVPVAPGLNKLASMALRVGFVPTNIQNFEEKKQKILQKTAAVTSKHPVNISKLSKLMISIEGAKDAADLILRCVKYGYVGDWSRHAIMSRIMKILLFGVGVLTFDCADKSASDRILSTTYRHISILSDIKRGLISQDLPARHQQEHIFMEM